MESIRNIGIFAHVDAGKTTLTEQILLKTGAIREAGRVDAGTAHTDVLAAERSRGISIRSGTVCVLHRDTYIRIIDTPGHIDFANEVETALLAVDGAVLVVSAVEGVQAQTAVIGRVLSSLKIPVIAFINKTDRAGADIRRVLHELNAITTTPVFMEESEGLLIDALSLYDDLLIEQALMRPIARVDIEAAAARACQGLHATPVLSGAALKGIGIERLLDAIIHYLPPPHDEDEFSVVAYHVRREGEERKVRLRVFGGALAIGAVGNGSSGGGGTSGGGSSGGNAGGVSSTGGDFIGAVYTNIGKVRRLRIQMPDGEKNVTALRPGEIGVAVGLEGLLAGMWLGKRVRGDAVLAAPVLRAQVVPDNDNDLPALLTSLERLHDENGNLHPTFEPRTRRVHIRTMGEIHQQVVEQTLLEDYGVSASLMPPEALYKETPIGVGAGSFDMMMDPWKARAAFRVEPGPNGSGVRFISATHVDKLHIKYQKDIEKTVYQALQEGVTGWPATDIIVTLTSGQGSWLSWGGASSHFGPVVPLGLFAALNDAGMRLLEPVYRFEAKVDERTAGVLFYELGLIRAQCDPFVFSNGEATISGLVPVETSQHFAIRVNELSHGRGVWRTRFEGYHHAPPGIGHPIPRTTPDPLNPSLYIDFITGRTKKITAGDDNI